MDIWLKYNIVLSYNLVSIDRTLLWVYHSRKNNLYLYLRNLLCVTIGYAFGVPCLYLKILLFIKFETLTQPRGYKTCLCLIDQLRMKFQLPIKTKMLSFFFAFKLSYVVLI